VHVDIRPLPHVDVTTSADRLEMFPDNSVDLMYCCHLLEHFKRGREIFVLGEWYRALKPGGILRLAVPDFDSIAAWYQRTHNLEDVMGLLYGKQDYEFNIHFQTFNFARLKDLLFQCGFRKVNRYEWRDTIHKDYDDFSQAYLPHLEREKGILMSLNVEAVK